MAGVRGDDNDFRSDAESERLGGKDDINVEVGRGRSRAPLLAGLCPKLRGEPQCLIAQGQIPVRVNLHEGIQTGEPRCLPCAQQLASYFVVDDSWDHHGVAARKAVDEPTVHRHDLRGDPRLSHDSERAGIQ